MYSLLVFFFGCSYVLTGGFMFCTIMCILLVFNTWVEPTSGALAPWVLPVTLYNSFLHVVIIILYLCMFGCDK